MSKRRYDTHQRSPDDDSDDGYRDRERKSSRKESYSDRNSYKSKSVHVKEKYDRNENDSRTDSVNRHKEKKGSSLEKDAESYRKTIKRKKTQYLSDENLSYNSKNSERRKQFQKDKEDNRTENEIDSDRENVKKNSKKYSERRTGFISDDDSLEDEKGAANNNREKVKKISKKYTERRTGFNFDDDSSGNEKMNNNSRSKANKKYSEEAQSKTHTDVIGKDNYRGNERKRNYYEKNNKTSIDASEDRNVSYGSSNRDRTNYSEKILSKVAAVDKDNKHYTSKERYSDKITENRKIVVNYSSEDENVNYSRVNKERSKYSEKTSKSSKISEEDDYYKIKSKEQKGKHSKMDSENKRSHIDAAESLSEGEIYSSRAKYSDKIRSKVTTAGIEDDHYGSKEGKNKHSEKKVIEIDISNNSTDDENYNRKKEKARYYDKIRNKTSIDDVEDNEHRNRERKGSYSKKNRIIVDISNDSSGNEEYNRKRIKHSDQMKSKIAADDSEDNHYRGKEDKRIHSEKHRSVVDKESSSEDEDCSKNKERTKYSGKIRSKVTSHVQDSPYRDGKRKSTISDKSRRVVDISDSSCEEENTNNGSKNRPREKFHENEGRHNKTWDNFEDNPSRSTDRRWKHLEKDTGKKNTEVDSESDFGNNKSKTNRQAEKLQQNVSSNEPQSKRVQIATINMRTGGAYIPPARLKMMQDQIKDKGSTEYQRIAWEALKKSIVGMTNKVNISNIVQIVPELLKENIIRGRGVLARAVMQAQAASPSFTRVYAALVAIINTKFPEIGELILKRLILQYRKGFRRNDKTSCLSACRFIAQLFNQEVAHEILILEIATHLIEIPTEDSVEIAIAFLKECGQKLTQLSKNGMRAITDRIRDILHDSKIDIRIRYMIEIYYAIQKEKFDSFKAVEPELDLVEESDKYTHLLNLDETVDGQDILNVFKFDPDYLENEEKYKSVVKEILGDSSGSEASDEDSDDEKEGEDEGGEKKTEGMEITDMTETNVVCLRRQIYLTIQSSLDFEECAHKLLKLEFKPGQIVEMCYMILDCCAQQRTYEKFFGLLAQRFCQINKIYAEPFTDIFENSYKTIHRLETNKLRNVANFFAHLLYTDAISWMVLSNIRLNEEETTSSSRVFIKILFQELCEYMGLKKLNERVQDVTFQEAFEGLFPRDHPHNTRFAINFFTSIGLGGLTDELREHLKNAPKKQAPPPPPVPEVDSGVPQSSESDSESESEEERNARKRKKKSKKKKK